MNYHTVKEISEIAERVELKVTGVWHENQWIVVELSSGLKVKILSW